MVFLANAHKSKIKIPLVTSSQVKCLINASKILLLIMVKIGAYGEMNFTLSMMCNTNFRSLMTCNKE